MSRKERKIEKVFLKFTTSLFMLQQLHVSVSLKAMRCYGIFFQSWEKLCEKKKKAAGSTKRCTLKPTAGPLMAWKKALIWISLFLSFSISIFSKHAASESHPRVFFFFFTGFLFPLAHHLLHKPPPQLHRVLFSRRCRSSSSSVSSSWVLNLSASPNWCWAAHFSAGVITIFCMPGTGRPENSPRVSPRGQQSIIDSKVFLINSGRAVTGGAPCLLQFVVIKVASAFTHKCTHTNAHTHGESSVQNAKLHDNKLLCRIWIWIHPSLHNCRAGSDQNTVVRVICFAPKKAFGIAFGLFLAFFNCKYISYFLWKHNVSVCDMALGFSSLNKWLFCLFRVLCFSAEPLSHLALVQVCQVCMKTQFFNQKWGTNSIMSDTNA